MNMVSCFLSLTRLLSTRRRKLCQCLPRSGLLLLLLVLVQLSQLTYTCNGQSTRTNPLLSLTTPAAAPQRRCYVSCLRKSAATPVLHMHARTTRWFPVERQHTNRDRSQLSTRSFLAAFRYALSHRSSSFWLMVVALGYRRELSPSLWTEAGPRLSRGGEGAPTNLGR